MNTLTDDIRQGAENNRQAERTRKRTTAQLPVFREAANLLYIVMKEMYLLTGKGKKMHPYPLLGV